MIDLHPPSPGLEDAVEEHLESREVALQLAQVNLHLARLLSLRTQDRLLLDSNAQKLDRVMKFLGLDHG